MLYAVTEELLIALVFTTNTWFGLRVVSEKIASLPFSETASTFPVTFPSPENGLVAVPKFAGLIAAAPISLPMYALSPPGSKRIDVGDDGSGISPPATGFAAFTL